MIQFFNVFSSSTQSLQIASDVLPASLHSIVYDLMRCFTFFRILMVSHVAYSTGKPTHLTKYSTLPLKTFLPMIFSTQKAGDVDMLALQINVNISAKQKIPIDSIQQYLQSLNMPQRPNDTSYSIRDQLERETQQLLQERSGFQVYKPSVTQIGGYSQNNLGGSPRSRFQAVGDTSVRKERRDNRKKGQLKNKILEIMELCKEENSATGGEFKEVIAAQRDILNLIQKNDVENFGNHAERSNHNQHRSSQAQQQPYPQQQHYPQPYPQQQPYQQQPYQQQHRSSQQQNNIPSNTPQAYPAANPRAEPGAVYRPGSQLPVYDRVDEQQQQQQRHQSPQPRLYTLPNQASQAHTFVGARPIGDASNNLRDNAVLSEDAQEMIDQIERRALTQIQKLKAQKLELMNQLNQQIRNVNIERKRNGDLSRQLDLYKKNSGYQSTAALDARQDQELRARLSYLQNLLTQQQQKNEYLRAQLQQGLNLPDIQLLYEQGEAIRQETLRLIKLKEQKLIGNGSYSPSRDPAYAQLRERIRDLQAENAQLKKIGKLSHDVQQEYSPIGKKNHVRTNSYRNSVNEYESLVSEMKKITGIN